MRVGGRTGLIWLAVVASWNWLLNRAIPPRFYTPANLAAAGVALLSARRRGIDVHAAGLDPRTVARGLRWGLTGGIVSGVAMWIASNTPATRAFFDDERADPERTTHETLVRIPLGTVVFEETLFRGLLPVVTESEAVASIAFGVWHVLPTLTALDINSVDDPQARRRFVLAGVSATAVAAWPLGWLRRRSGSLVAPMVAHWAVNGTGFVLAAKRRRLQPE